MCIAIILKRTVYVRARTVLAGSPCPLLLRKPSNTLSTVRLKYVPHDLQLTHQLALMLAWLEAVSM